MDYERPKFVIAWLAIHVDQKTAYYTGTTYEDMKWGGYTTESKPTIHSSHYLSQAIVFDTAEDALKVEKELKSSYTHVKPVSGKKLFLAKLKEESNEA